jgi:molecular chaperone DnaK (HSP70)
VKKDTESWPFKVIDQDGSPMVEVEYLGETKTFSPQEISAMVLSKVRNNSSPVSMFILLTLFKDERGCRGKAW